MASSHLTHGCTFASPAGKPLRTVMGECLPWDQYARLLQTAPRALRQVLAHLARAEWGRPPSRKASRTKETQHQHTA